MLKLSFTVFPIIKTDRLILREHTLQDAQKWFELRHNPNVMRYIDRESPKDIEEVEGYINNLITGFEMGESMGWAIALKDNPAQMIGNVVFWRMDFPNYRAEIGYLIDPEYWRKGLVSEALTAIIAFAFQEMKLHSIEANINPHNEASRRLLLKQGFVKEAYFKEDYYFNGKFLDSEIYSLISPSEDISREV
jgi:ribosomal-protein-alanine N-acetyltransferase